MPALQLHLAATGPESFPKSLEVIKSYDRMQQAFPGTGLPANVVVKAASVRTPAMKAAITRARAAGARERPRVRADHGRREPGGHGREHHDPDRRERNRRRVERRLPDAARDGRPRDGRRAFRERTPASPGRRPQWRDQADALKSNLPPVVAFVLLFAFGLMLVAFRSIVIAIKAIVLNLLSVAAAYGVLVLVFQHGFGKGLLGISSTAGIEAVVPLLLFVILFGLSMDYHVFIISRIRETYDRGKSMDEAVSYGIKSTAGVVTSAALVMVAVFAVFATLSMPFFKQFGVGLAVAILIDATIVRAVLLPASMKLLGDWNWYLPTWLEWLPTLEDRSRNASSSPLARRRNHGSSPRRPEHPGRGLDPIPGSNPPGRMLNPLEIEILLAHRLAPWNRPAELVFDVDADDLREVGFCSEPEHVGAARVEIAWPAGDDSHGRLVGLAADAPHNLFAGDAAQGLDLLGHGRRDPRHRQTPALTEGAGVDRRCVKEEADRRARRCVAVAGVVRHREHCFLLHATARE